MVAKGSLERRIEQQLDLRRQLFKRSLFATAHTLLGYRDVNWATHGDMITALEAPTKRKLIVMPRGSLKSTVASVSYPIQCLIKDPNLRILLDGEVYGNAATFLREIKLQLQRPELIELFGEFQTQGCWNEGEIIIAQRTKVLKEGSITASGIGAEKTGQHYDLIICDDLNSPKNSGTKEGREKVMQHWRYNTSILEPHGTMALIGTRYAADDAIGIVARNEIGLDLE
jgi:hypothetical protein